MNTRSSTPWVALAALFGGAALVGLAAANTWAPDLRVRVARAYRLAARALGVEPPTLVFSDGVANAQSDGDVVAINLRWVRRVLGDHCRDNICTDQVLIGILAHELAHHVFGHARMLRVTGSTRWETWIRHQLELQADRAAGAALGRLRIGSREFSRVLAFLSLRVTATHPEWQARVASIRAGYLSMT